MSTIFRLTAHDLNLTEEEPRAYPLPIYSEIVGFFTSLGRAEEFMRTQLLAGQTYINTADLFSLELEEITLDTVWHVLNCRIYSPDGSLHGQQLFYAHLEEMPLFFGRPSAECRFKAGDWVEFRSPYGREAVHLGLVVAPPFTPEELAERQRLNPKFILDMGDDVYMVVFWAGDHLDHAHLEESRMVEPQFEVEEELQQRIRTAWDALKERGNVCSVEE